ncbi:hypothetical protein CC86DRAFT_116568 [Ophiobolus disseminans]|uniref:Uncharacterized protein n=1 Tax=Ophiobolus disseminans TaxID=1469910 RepID=A0A6A6ZHX6_9PLEO|nr:hypothetical protein CC86DRAFT_116568 [Ophiobolus disseminans]
MTVLTKATLTDAVGFIDLPRELRDLVYMQALSDNGQTVIFTLIEPNGRKLLLGPDVLDFLLSCRTVYHETIWIYT